MPKLPVQLRSCRDSDVCSDSLSDCVTMSETFHKHVVMLPIVNKKILIIYDYCCFKLYKTLSPVKIEPKVEYIFVQSSFLIAQFKAPLSNIRPLEGRKKITFSLLPPCQI